MITQMHVKGLMFDPYNNAYIVVLRDEEHADMLPIWVGKSEAARSACPWKMSRPLGQ